MPSTFRTFACNCKRKNIFFCILLAYWIIFIHSTKENHSFCSRLFKIFVPLHPKENRGITKQEHSSVGLERFSHIEEVLGSSPNVPTKSSIFQRNKEAIASLFL